jgi:ankyrin repeat protein
MEDELCHAVVRDDAEGIKRIVAAGGNPNTKTNCGVPPITLALKMRSKRALSALLSAGADVDLPDQVEGSSILMEAYFGAVEFDEPETMELLLDAGLSIDRLDKDGMALLMHAAIFRLHGVEFFLKRGANPNIRSREGWTPLMYAVQTDSSMVNDGTILDVAKVLITHGADVTLKNPAGDTAADIFSKQRYDEYKPAELMDLLR